jgi:hypothetical protein
LKHVEERAAADTVGRDHAAAGALQRLPSKSGQLPSTARPADRGQGGDPLERA